MSGLYLIVSIFSFLLVMLFIILGIDNFDPLQKAMCYSLSFFSFLAAMCFLFMYRALKYFENREALAVATYRHLTSATGTYSDNEILAKEVKDYKLQANFAHRYFK